MRESSEPITPSEHEPVEPSPRRRVDQRREGSAEVLDLPGDESVAAESKRIRSALRRLAGRSEEVMPSAPESTEPAEGERPAWRGDVQEGGESLTEMPEVQRSLHETVERAREGVARWGPEDQERARSWFGSASPEVRQNLGEVLERLDLEIDRVRMMPFEADQDPDEMAETFAYVYPDDQERRVYVGELFRDAGDDPPDSKAGILVHEMSHFRDIGATQDERGAYGVEGSRLLAVSRPEVAQRTADNLQYFVEEYAVEEGRR